MGEPLKKLEFYVPVQTVSELNRRDHWTVTHKRKKAQREATFYEWKRAAAGRPVALPCVVRMVRIGPKMLDDGDNLSSAFKAIRDQVAEMLGVDDGGAAVTWEYDQVAIGERSYNVKIQVESL